MLDWIDLKDELPEEIWNSVVQGEDERLGEKFLNKARAWLSARLSPCGISSWDESDEIIKQILLIRALYEFYAYIEKEELAFDKRDTAEEMLRARFGPCVDSAYRDESRYKEDMGLPVGNVVSGRDSWEGF